MLRTLLTSSFLVFLFVNPLHAMYQDEDGADAQHKRGQQLLRDKPSDAISWLEKAANNGHVHAQQDLGIYYEYGWPGIQKDPHKAIIFYKMAAKQGDEISLNNLANMYYRGLGVQQDYYKARRWYAQLARRGNEWAKTCLTDIEAKISKNQSKSKLNPNYSNMKVHSYWENPAPQHVTLDPYLSGNLGNNGGESYSLPPNKGQLTGWAHKAN